jgi:hypothetical protein
MQQNMIREQNLQNGTEPAIGYEPMLANALSKKQKMELLEKSQMFEALTFKQIRALIWWEWFKPKKLNKFYEMLQIGKAARFAFEDVQRYHETKVNELNIPAVGKSVCDYDGNSCHILRIGEQTDC